MSHQPASGAVARRTVVIESCPDLREVLGLALHRGGFAVVGAAPDSRIGIELIGRTFPDVVLLDGLAGLTTIRAMLPRARIVVFAGSSRASAALRATAEGADGYLLKSAGLRHVVRFLGR